MSDTYGAGDAPLVPGNVPSPDVNAPAQTGGLADSWRSWMSDPHNRAAMMQFGIALSQPIGAGQNALGQVGSALGQAGEASDRITAEQRAEAEAESKQELRKSGAELASERAAHVGDTSLFKQSQAEDRRTLRDLMDQKNIQTAYIAELRRIDAANAKIRSDNIVAAKGEKKAEIPSPTQEEFAARYRGMGMSGAVAPVAGAGAVTSGTPEERLQQAKDAISRGADPAAVKKKLQDMGIDSSGL